MNGPLSRVELLLIVIVVLLLLIMFGVGVTSGDVW
jgi:hypothetical protein